MEGIYFKDSSQSSEWGKINNIISAGNEIIVETTFTEQYKNGTISFQAKDNAGNVSDVKEITLIFENVEYDIQIIDTDGTTKIYNIPRNSNITMEKMIQVTPSNGNMEDITIQYSFTKNNQTSPGWITVTSGSTITETLNYNTGHGIYNLKIQLVDSEGNVLVEKVQQYIFNGASTYA